MSVGMLPWYFQFLSCIDQHLHTFKPRREERDVVDAWFDFSSIIASTLENSAKWIIKLVNNEPWLCFSYYHWALFNMAWWSGWLSFLRTPRLTFNNVLINDIMILAHQLRLELYSMYDSHLLEKCRLSRLASSQKKQFHLEWGQNMPRKRVAVY